MGIRDPKKFEKHCFKGIVNAQRPAYFNRLPNNTDVVKVTALLSKNLRSLPFDGRMKIKQSGLQTFKLQLADAVSK